MILTMKAAKVFFFVWMYWEGKSRKLCPIHLPIPQLSNGGETQESHCLACHLLSGSLGILTPKMERPKQAPMRGVNPELPLEVAVVPYNVFVLRSSSPPFKSTFLSLSSFIPLPYHYVSMCVCMCVLLSYNSHAIQLFC